MINLTLDEAQKIALDFEEAVEISKMRRDPIIGFFVTRMPDKCLSLFVFCESDKKRGGVPPFLKN